MWDFEAEVQAGITSGFDAQIASAGRYISEAIDLTDGSTEGVFVMPTNPSKDLHYLSTLTVSTDAQPNIDGELTPPATGESQGARLLSSLAVSTLAYPYPLRLSFTLDGGNAALAGYTSRNTGGSYSLYALTEPRYAVNLTERLPGDFNDDGRVDIADYTVWRDGLGVVTPAITSYAAWTENFGRILNEASQATPEPRTLMLLLILATNYGGEWRRVTGTLPQGSPRD